MTPTLGIDQVTTFTARVEVKDPDGDPVSVTLLSLWQFPKGTPVELNGGVGVVSFKTIDGCGPVLIGKGPSPLQSASAGHPALHAVVPRNSHRPVRNSLRPRGGRHG